MNLFKSLSVVLFSMIFFLLNPLVFGCGEEPAEDYSFGAEEMSAMVVGDWTGTIDEEGEDSVAFQLVLSQAEETSQVRQALCGSRTLVASADACVATSEMPLVGELTLDGEEPRSVEGYFMVVGLHLTGGELYFESEDEHFNIIINEDEDVHEGGTADSKTLSIERPADI